MSSEWDTVIVGGGAAGLSAALVLGRARRRTLLLDGGRQSNRAAEAIGGLLGNDGRPPAEFYAAARAELEPYPSVELRDVEAVDGAPDGKHGYVLQLQDGSEERARTVLLATGMEYRYPDLPGARERWGHSVFHCPFCHGWEVRDRQLAVFGADEAAVHRALMLRGWSESVALLTQGAELDDETHERLAAAGVEVEERPPAELRGEGRELAAIVFADGDERPCGGLLVPITLARRSPLPERLGAATAAPNPITEEGIEVDAMMNAGAPGLYAAGDLVPRAPSVAAAVASGSLAAAAIVHALAG